MLAFPTRVHGLIDYGLGAVAVASPWLFGFADVGAAKTAAIAAGMVIVVYGLLTDFEWGAVRRIQIPLHLWLDGVVGLVLAISPWLLEFDGQVWAPHVVLGAALLVMAFFSETIPGYERRVKSEG